jgi:hypothetical protein
VEPQDCEDEVARIFNLYPVWSFVVGFTHRLLGLWRQPQCPLEDGWTLQLVCALVQLRKSLHLPCIEVRASSHFTVCTVLVREVDGAQVFKRVINEAANC